MIQLCPSWSSDLHPHSSYSSVHRSSARFFCTHQLKNSFCENRFNEVYGKQKHAMPNVCSNLCCRHSASNFQTIRTRNPIRPESHPLSQRVTDNRSSCPLALNPFVTRVTNLWLDRGALRGRRITKIWTMPVIKSRVQSFHTRPIGIDQKVEEDLPVFLKLPVTMGEDGFSGFATVSRAWQAVLICSTLKSWANMNSFLYVLEVGFNMEETHSKIHTVVFVFHLKTSQ